MNESPSKVERAEFHHQWKKRTNSQVACHGMYIHVCTHMRVHTHIRRVIMNYM